MTSRSNLCPQHLLTDMGLSIRPSTIPGAGLGLFTEVPRARHEFISDYTGDLMYDDTDTIHEYAVGISGDWIIDAARTNTAPARYINDPRMPGKINTRFVHNYANATEPERIRVITTKAISRVPAELFLAYGRLYWHGVPRVVPNFKPVGPATHAAQYDTTPEGSDDENDAFNAFFAAAPR